MDLKHLTRIGAVLIALLLIVFVVYTFIYLPYNWELTGVAKDVNGDTIEGAVVTLKTLDVGSESHEESEESTSIRTTMTDKEGVYRFSSNIFKQIPPGLYRVNASKKLSDGIYYSGYDGMIQLTGTNIKQNILWTRGDDLDIFSKHGNGLKFLGEQVKPDESAGGGGGEGSFWLRVDLTNLGDEYSILIENTRGNNVSTSLIRDEKIMMVGRPIFNSTAVDLSSRADGKYPEFLNAIVFAGFEESGVKEREGVYKLTAKQREVIFAPVTTGELAKDVYDDEGNWAGHSPYMDMTLMSKEYFDRYFEIVKSKTINNEERVEYRCKDNEEAWETYKTICTNTQHCDNEVAVKYMCGDDNCECK